MISHARRIAVVAIVLAPAWVATSIGNDTVPAAASGVAAGRVPPRIIVMKNGMVVEGRIRIAQGGYEVDRNGGRFFLADSLVWYTAESRQGAYKILRERIPYATADSHVRIAEWCVENQLLQAAEEELRLALRLEPDNDDARALLRLLNTDTQNDRTNILLPSGLEETPTLGGLPPESARAFVTRVQPILVNRCGNASCHGASSGSAFTLQNARHGNPAFKAYTHANLDVVLKQVTPESPLSSPLLAQVQRKGHGGSRKPIFFGRAGESQLQAIADWIIDVAKAPSVSTGKGEVGETHHLQLTSGSDTPGEATQGVTNPDSAAGQRASPAGDNAPPDDSANEPERDAASKLLDSVIRNERPDAFDPEEFNRRFAPRSDPSPLSSSDGPMR